MTRYILDADGNPQPCPDLMTWAKWFEANDDARRVAIHYEADVKVSTVFLGLDHAFTLGPPVLFETMIFGGQHDGYQERYHTRDEAIAGHAQAVKLLESVA